MFFKEILGQDKIKKKLIQTVKENRISHAQLFIGPESSGKLSLAIAYAQYVCCENKQDDDSCGICSSCKKYQKLIHPDLHFVFPVIKAPKYKDAISDNYITEWRKLVLTNPYFTPSQWYEAIDAENKQGSIYADESSEIVKKLNLKTFEADYKVMIIWLPEKMNITAANKLLKVLEEPPPQTLFIMISEAPGEILITIRSRTQLLKIPKIDDESLSAYLSEYHHLDPQQTIDVVRLANGNYTKAINSINMSEENKINFKYFSSLMRSCYSSKIIDIVNLVDELSAIGREKQKNFFFYSLRLIRENFMLNLKTPQIVYLSGEEATFSDRFHTFINERNIVEITETFNKAHYHIERNGYNKIIFLDMALTLIKLLKK